MQCPAASRTRGPQLESLQLRCSVGPVGRPPTSQVSGCRNLLSTRGAALGQARAGAPGKEKGRPRPHEFQVAPPHGEHGLRL